MKKVWYVSNWLSLEHYPARIESGELLSIEDGWAKIKPAGCIVSHTSLPEDKVNVLWGYLPS